MGMHQLSQIIPGQSCLDTLQVLPIVLGLSNSHPGVQPGIKQQDLLLQLVKLQLLPEALFPALCFPQQLFMGLPHILQLGQHLGAAMETA